jgi:hypothetical protein
MAINYTTYVAQLAALVNIPSSDSSFQTILPGCIDYAEGRCYRDIDIFTGNVRDGSASCTPNSRNFNLPTGAGTYIIVDGLNVITPASTAPDSGTRIPLTPASQSVLDTIYPSSTNATVPRFFSYITNNTYLSGGATQSQIIFGPWPDAAYRIEVTGKIQLAPLSASNTNTYLTDYLPDLFIAASMIYMSGYMRNFGSQADDPRMSSSWESQYENLLKGAAVYESRKKFAGPSWTAKAPEPIAVPQRG